MQCRIQNLKIQHNIGGDYHQCELVIEGKTNTAIINMAWLMKERPEDGAWAPFEGRISGGKGIGKLMWTIADHAASASATK